MSMTILNEAEKITCRFDGDMDTVACNEIADELNAIMDDCKKNGLLIEFDLENVRYIASSFLRLCGKAVQHVGQTRFSIINVLPPVKKVFKIAGLADGLNIP